MRKLKDILLEKKLVSPEKIERAQEIARQTGKPFFTVLVDNNFAAEETVLEILAEQQGLEFIRPGELSVDESAVKNVSAKVASHYAVMPFKLEAGVLTIAVSNPGDVSAVEDIETNLGFRVERVLACRADIMEALRKYYGVGADTVEKLLSESQDHGDSSTQEESYDLGKMAEDASVVRLVNQLFQEAINDRATDIHFEVCRDGISVRRRIDGELYDTKVPKDMKLLYPAIVSRVKLMSRLNIVERRLPQDGRARVSIGRKEYDLRISVVPSMHGEDIVVRILPSAMLFNLSDLGFSREQLDNWHKYIARPFGIIFVTGPTGSGKSTTLYACLSELNTRDRKIITIEDPVEYELKGITQTQINPPIGLTFASALRSMLRHDPDVMMIGEVRDKETAEIATQAAMTGHLVFSTLHTNDSAGGAVRLVDMGIDPYRITSTVIVFTAQRLVRVICSDCRKETNFNGKKAYKGSGCKSCNNSGYHGRIAISEFLPMTSEIQDLILQKASAGNIREKADLLGFKTLSADGWEKVEKGQTTPEEVIQVTSM